MLDLFMKTHEYSEMLSQAVDSDPKHKDASKKRQKLYEKLKEITPSEDYWKMILDFDNSCVWEETCAMDAAYKKGFQDGIRMIMGTLTAEVISNV